MPARKPTPEQALAAMQRIEPFLGRYSSAWCRKVLYSTLHHTAGAFDQAALKTKPLGAWLGHEPWPLRRIADIYHPFNLHWCEECLHSGYHSFAHQLRGLTHCPLHGTPIRQGCPHCEFSVLMRSERSLESQEPFRNCLHCHKPLLQLTTSPKWPKSAKFLALEHQALRRFFYWAQRVDRLHDRVYLHSEGAVGHGPRWPSGEQFRLALEVIHSLPPNIQVAPPPPGLRITSLTLDRHNVRQAPVTREDRVQWGVELVEHLGQGPVPPKWLQHWRTGKPETPVPKCAGECSHFDLWKERVLSVPDWFAPPHPAEVLRPCMLPLLAARVVGYFEECTRKAAYYENPDPSFSVFFTDLHGVLAKPPLGERAGIIVEMHNTLRALEIAPPPEPPKQPSRPRKSVAPKAVARGRFRPRADAKGEKPAR